MRFFSNQNGFIKPVLSLVFLALVLYSGFQFGMPYYRYSAFKSDVKDITRIGSESADRIKTQVYESAKSYKIPIEEKDITVRKGDSVVQVKVSWTEQVDIFGLYKRTLYFKIDMRD